MNPYILLAQDAVTVDPWAQEFLGLNAEQRFVILIIAITCITGVICTIVGCATSVISSMHRRRVETDLKHELLDRGMSADEIARVVEATQPTDFLERWASGRKKAV